MKYGSIPAGGLGTRLQPIGFSKELAPVAGRAVIEFLIDRMLTAGIDKIFINTAEDKTDLIRYLSTKSPYSNHLIYLVRERRGLLDGICQPVEFLRPDDEIYFGLPDTLWYPKDGFVQVCDQAGDLVLGLFDTGTPERFDSVVIDNNHRITSIEVKVPQPRTKWTWAIGKISVGIIPELYRFEKENNLEPGAFGTAMNMYAQDNPAYAVELKGSSCLDIGQLGDYRRADDFVEAHEK